MKKRMFTFVLALMMVLGTPVQLGEGYRAVCHSMEWYYLLKEDGTLWRNRYAYGGQSGQLEQLLSGVVQLAGDVALKEDGTVWELDSDGAHYVMGGAKQVSCGSTSQWPHSNFALKEDGTLWSWGSGDDAGRSTEGQDMSQPGQVMDQVAYTAGSMAIRTDGTLWCWGDNTYGAVGDGSGRSQHTPVKILDNVVGAWQGDTGSMGSKYALTKDGTLYSWGFNQAGQLGYEDGNAYTSESPYVPAVPYQTTPKAVEVDNVAAVYGDFTTLMLLKKDGSLWRYQDGAFVKLLDGVKCPGTVEQAKSDRPSPWAEEFVNTAIEAGLVPQDLQSQYTQATTRAEFCALGVKLYEVIAGQEIQSRATFTDTQDENVEKLASLGVIAGVGEGRFSPDSALNREQAALILANLAKALGCPLPASTATFADSGSISDWARAAVGQVQAAGVMSGVGENTFAPAASYSREQSITTILTLYSQVR